MRKEDESIPKNSVECNYRGETMRSLLEMRTAKLLDKLEIEWTYEPEHYSLNQGKVNYLPDFKIKNTDLFIEPKGVYQEDDEKKVANFVKETGNELLLISADKASFVRKPENKQVEYSKAHLIKCSNCNKHCFVPNLGSWHCRYCNNHNGDRDIEVYNLLSSDPYIKEKTLQLKNEQTIENWFETVKTT